MDQNKDLIITVFVTYTTILAGFYLEKRGYNKAIYFGAITLPIIGSIIFANKLEFFGNKITAAGFSLFVVILIKELITLNKSN